MQLETTKNWLVIDLLAARHAFLTAFCAHKSPLRRSHCIRSIPSNCQNTWKLGHTGKRQMNKQTGQTARWQKRTSRSPPAHPNPAGVHSRVLQIVGWQFQNLSIPFCHSDNLCCCPCPHVVEHSVLNGAEMAWRRKGAMEAKCALQKPFAPLGPTRTWAQGALHLVLGCPGAFFTGQTIVPALPDFVPLIPLSRQGNSTCCAALCLRAHSFSSILPTQSTVSRLGMVAYCKANVPRQAPCIRRPTRWCIPDAEPVGDRLFGHRSGGGTDNGHNFAQNA